MLQPDDYQESVFPGKAMGRVRLLCFMVAVMTPCSSGSKVVAVCVDLPVYTYTYIATSCQASSLGVLIRGASLDNEICAVSGTSATLYALHYLS